MLRRPNLVKKIHAHRKGRRKPEPEELLVYVDEVQASMKLFSGLREPGVLSDASLEGLQANVRALIVDAVRAAVPAFAEAVNAAVTEGERYSDRLDRQLLVGSMAIAYEVAQVRVQLAYSEAMRDLMLEDHVAAALSIEEDVLGRLAPRVRHAEPVFLGNPSKKP